MMTEVERNMVGALGDRNYMFAKRMSDPSFVKYVGILSCEVAYHYETAKYEREYILNYC